MRNKVEQVKKNKTTISTEKKTLSASKTILPTENAEMNKGAY